MAQFFDPHTQVKHSRNNRRVTILINYLRYLLGGKLLHKKIFSCESWISQSWGIIEHNNLGDDINVSFISKISKDLVLPRRAKEFPLKDASFYWLNDITHVACIGSILHMIDNPNTVIWGTGALSEDYPPMIPLNNIKAVRGPLTRELLLSRGINCPTVYGDPALLLPYYYHPKKRKRYRLGIIPHYVDANKLEVTQFLNDSRIIVINMYNYNNWQSVIDKICSCDFIASSSLHGLIISEAYHIPNLWIEVSEPIEGDTKRRFKYHDFFQSIGLDRDMPYLVQNGTSFEDIIIEKDSYKQSPGLSLAALVDACPFKLKPAITPIS